MTAPSRRVLKAACERLAETDIALARAYEAIGVPDWRAHSSCLALLGDPNAHQQISPSAAVASCSRVDPSLVVPTG